MPQPQMGPDQGGDTLRVGPAQVVILDVFEVPLQKLLVRLIIEARRRGWTTVGDSCEAGSTRPLPTLIHGSRHGFSFRS